MKIKFSVVTLLSIFIAYCGVLVLQSGVFSDDRQAGLDLLASQSEIGSVVDSDVAADGYDLSLLQIVPGISSTLSLGSVDNQSDYLFELNLDSKGASMPLAVVNRFETLDYKNRKDFLDLLNPVMKSTEAVVSSLATDSFILVDQGLKVRLSGFDWQSTGIRSQADGSESASFHTIILDANKKPVIKITKTYSLTPMVNDIGYSLTVENLSDQAIKSRFDLQGTTGLPREGARMDMRKLIAGYKLSDDTIETVKLTNAEMRKQLVSTAKGKQSTKEMITAMSLAHEEASAKPLWIASVNKYFSAIVIPMPQGDSEVCDWIRFGKAQYFAPGLWSNPKQEFNKDENSSYALQVKDFDLAGRQSRTFDFRIYLGSKDKPLFEDNDFYSSLGLVNVIDFQACFGDLFRPLSMGILAALRWIYFFIPNYGIVIIILVLLVRLCLHPITKKSQVSMMSMQKLAPKAEEIKRKYANNKAEMNKHMMGLYKEHGASPIMGCLPMLLQMPIWIALYSAIYASVELRGEGLLPFWITDLSSPDALFRFKAFTIPLLNAQIDSFNLLPVLLGLFMFLQQKMMSPATASTNSQMAQQQKMMLIMMPVMMLLFLYKAPSGLNLYIMTSTFAGIIEQKIIRKHIKERQEAEDQGKVSVTSKTGGKVKKKKPKPMMKY